LKKAIETLQNSGKDNRDVSQLKSNEKMLEQEVTNLKQEISHLKQITVDPNSKVLFLKIKQRNILLLFFSFFFF